MSHLKRILTRQSEQYTSEIIHKQALEAATRAWEANDFVRFIEILERIGFDGLPHSFQLKYKLAKQKFK